MNITLRHLEILRAVSAAGSFTKAAEELFITQSAVSHAVHDLEEMTETPLFDRLSRKVHITRAGELLLEEAKPILSACQTLTAHLKDLGQAAPVHIAANITIANFCLPCALKKFHEVFPAVQVTVDVVPAATAIEYLQSEKTDIALVEGAIPPGPFTSKVFGSYNLKVVCSSEYLPSKTRLSLKQLCSEKLLLREPGSAIRDAIDSQLYLAGRSVQPIWCSVNSSALLAAAKEGLGITILPEAYLAEELKKQRLVELFVPGLMLQNNMYVVWHRNKYLPEPLKIFVEKLQTESFL